jgi:pimeloyl-ACP methyl ester carboxylesterase
MASSRPYSPALLVAAVFCSLQLVTSCGDGGGGTEPTPATVASVEVAPSSGSVQVGGTLQLTAIARDAAGGVLTGRTVTWSSSDSSVLTVSPGGLVTGVHAGVASVGATSEGKTGSASVSVPSHTLSVATEGSGNGRVTSTPGGIDCGSACAGGFGAGTTVILTASPAGGSVFSGWSGACTGAASTCQLTMSMDRSVAAGFGTASMPTHTLTVTKVGGGAGTVTSSPAGIDCGASCSAPYDSGTVVALTAVPSSGSVFTGWAGGCVGTETTCQVSMGGGRAVTASFGATGPGVHRLTVWKSGSGDGTVTSLPAGISCGADCTADYPSGTVVVLSATSAQGSVFMGWSGACVSSGSTCRVTMGAPQLVMAEFWGGPRVVSTVPEQGALDVDPGISTLEFCFSEPMAGCGGYTNFGWWPYTISWSADGRTLLVTRGTAGSPLWGQRVTFQPLLCSSLAGIPLESPFVLRFTTRFRVPPIRVGANPSRGFHWPYYLVLPKDVASPPTLLVEPNNTGVMSDDLQVHEEAAKDLLSLRLAFAEELGSPLLIPVLPRPVNPPAPEFGGIYVHALDRYSLSNSHPGLQRIDLQMVAMLDDALDRLETMGYAMDRRVFMMGFSASGSFTSRFALIHPDRLKAAAPGSPGYGWPMAPVASWGGAPLRYPLGIMDFEALVGKPFDLATFRSVPLYIYVGGEDTNGGMEYALRGMSEEERSQVAGLLNWPQDPVRANRWPLIRTIYESVGANAQLVIYPGVGHTLTPQMLADVRAFFQSHR